MGPFNEPERKEGKNSEPTGVDGIKTPKVDSHLSAIYQNAPLIMMLVDAEGRIKKVNRFAAEFAGRSESEMIGLYTGKALRCSHALDNHSENGFGAYCTECPIRGTIKDTLETERSHYQVQANPTLIIEGREQELTFLLSTTSLQIDGESMVLVTILDITERKQAEAKQALLTDILRVHNRGGNLHSLTAETLRLIRVRTGFDSVGLRLRQGEDCPYFEHNGFSEEFLNEENFLCAKDGNRAIVRDAQGHTVLECTCGLVLSGRTVPGMSCFTEGGSFWTNISSELLSLPRESDPRFNPRNQCIHKGYQSVGLFPVRAGQEIIGLLQLNDRREGMFTPDLITFYESLAQNIGLAFQRAAAEEALWDLNEKLELQVTERTKLAESRAKQLARLTSELSLAEERERRRLAEVLHEHLQQLLVGVRLNLDALSGHVYGEKRPILDTARQLICDSIQTSRSITAELSPPILYQAGLVSGLKWLSRWKQEKYGLTVDLQVEPENITLKEDMIVILFRSVRELLLNVMKHSGVNSAKVSLSEDGSDCLRIVVSDAGKGFNPDQIWESSVKQNGFGLFSIRERLEFLGGRLEIESAPGKGASFTLIAPC
jgi:signal transduction histidine kinase